MGRADPPQTEVQVFLKNLCNQFSVYMDAELAWWAEILFDAWRDLGNGVAKTGRFLLCK